MSVQDLADELFEAQEELDEYHMKHIAVIQGFTEMRDRVSSLQSMMAEAAKAETEGYGEHECANTGTHRLVISIRRGNRKIDAQALLEAHPELVEWEGLLSVKTGGFDKAVAAKVISRELADEVTSHAKDVKSASFVPVDA